MTYEHKPEGFDHQFDPLSEIDHSLVCSALYDHFTRDGSVSTAMQEAQSTQESIDEETFRLLFTVGYYFVPMDAEGKLTNDIEKLRVYVSSLVAALVTLDSLCISTGIDINVFRNGLRVGGDIKIIDVNQKVLENATEQQKRDAIGEGILHEGEKTMASIDPVYSETIERISDKYPEVFAYSNIFKLSYGYLIGTGINTIRRILSEREAQRVLNETDFNMGFNDLVSTESSVLKIDQTSDSDENGIHTRIADTLDTELFFSEDGVEAYIGKAIADRLDSDEATVEILNALALANYPNERRMFSLDHNGEAFFMGTNVAMGIITKIAAYKKVDDRIVAKVWRSDPVHMMLYRGDAIPESRVPEVDRKMTKIFIGNAIHPDYERIADKICDELEYDIDEAVAFKNGFQYVLSTGSDAVNKASIIQIKRSVKHEAKGLDEEIRNFLSDET